MGSSPSFTQAQCPVNRLQLPIRCQRCANKKLKWKCEECVLVFCDKCGCEDHDVKGHHIIDITTSQVKISDVKEYQAIDYYITFIAVAHDNSLWIGSGMECQVEALQNVKLVGDEAKVISSFNLLVWDVAVTPNNDILLATGMTVGSKLKQIKAGSNKVSDSIYCTEKSFKHTSVHVTKDGQVIVGGDKVVVVMDADGKLLTRYEKNKNNKQIFRHTITSITSTIIGNIFVACYFDRKVVVFRNSEIINIYRGHPFVNSEDSKFYPSSVVTTPIDNVIVADSFNNTLHILNNTGHLLTTYNTKDIGIEYPNHLAMTTKGSLNVLYIMTDRLFFNDSLYKMVITGC